MTGSLRQLVGWLVGQSVQFPQRAVSYTSKILLVNLILLGLNCCWPCKCNFIISALMRFHYAVKAVRVMHNTQATRK